MNYLVKYRYWSGEGCTKNKTTNNNSEKYCISSQANR